MPLIVREFPAPSARRDLAVRLPGRRRRRPRRPGAGGGRSTGRRPGWSASSAASGSRGDAVARRRRRALAGARPRPGAPRAGARRGSPSRSAPTERAGWRGRGGPRARTAPTADRAAFAARLRARRCAAPTRAERYFFDRRYFDAVLVVRAQLAGRRAPQGGELGAAAIAAVSDGVLHYFLGGTADAAPRRLAVQERGRRRCSTSPTSWSCRSTSAAGSTPGDGLERVQARLRERGARRSRTHEIVCDPDAYERAQRRRRDAGGLLPRLPRVAERATSASRRRRRAAVGGGRRAAALDPRLDPAGGSAGSSRASASPGHAVSPTVPWPNTLLRRTRRPAG